MRLTLAVLLIFSCLPVWSSDLQIFAVEEPPSSFIGAAGKPQGFAIDMVRAIQQEVGNADDILFVPEVRAMKIAEDTPNVVLFGFSRTEEREQDFYWITPLARKSWVLYAHESAPVTLASLDEAKVLERIGVVRGDVRATHLKTHGFRNIDEVAYHELNVKMLKNQRIDLLYYEPLGMAYASKKLGMDPAEFTEVLITGMSEVWVLMSKSTDAEIAQRWQTAAQKLRKNGSFEQIARKWSAIIHEETGTRSKVVEGLLTF